MNWFDSGIIHFANSFAHRSWSADTLAAEIAANDFLNSGALMVMFWGAWFANGEKIKEKRELLFLCLFLTPLSVMVARLLALHLPYRERPLHIPALNFQLPYNVDPSTLIKWSSFPSDHAVLCFCMAVGLWMVSRHLGMVAIIFSCLLNLDRVYLGYHYPTDIIAGALLGAGFAYLAKAPVLRTLARRGLTYLERRPAYLYSLLFFCTYQVASLFMSMLRFLFVGIGIYKRCTHREVEAVAAASLLAGLLGIAAWLKWARNHSVVVHSGRIVGNHS
jgi:undecaprenyl-diphosphatase